MAAFSKIIVFTRASRSRLLRPASLHSSLAPAHSPRSAILHPCSPIHPTAPDSFHSFPRPRSLSPNASPNDYSAVLDDINAKFAEAREEIEMAMESKETVYFNEEAETARAAVKVVLDSYEGLLARLPESEKATVQRSMGLKMEQLKAELEQLNG